MKLNPFLFAILSSDSLKPGLVTTHHRQFVCEIACTVFIGWVGAIGLNIASLFIQSPISLLNALSVFFILSVITEFLQWIFALRANLELLDSLLQQADRCLISRFRHGIYLEISR